MKNLGLHCSGSLVVYLSAGLFQVAVAQQVPSAPSNSGDSNDVQTVNIRVTRSEAKNSETPASIDTINRAQIEDAKAQVNLSEVLGGVPGLVANNRNNYAQDLQLSSRGFGARTAFGVRGLRIYVDGIPGNSPDGQGQISHIDLGSARLIEVLRGPFASIYGNSSGGVINVVTQSGGPDTESTTSLAAGSFGSYKLGQKFSGGSQGFNYVVDLSRYTTDGWRAHSAATKDNINARLGFQLGANTQATLVLNSVNIPDAQDPQGLALADLVNPRGVVPSVLTFNTRKSTKQSQLGLDVVHKFNAEHSLKFAAYGGQRDVTQYQATAIAAQTAATSAGGVVDLARDYQGIDTRYTFRRSLDNGPLLLHVGLTSDRLAEVRRGFDNFIANAAINPDPLCISGTSRLFLCGVQGKLRRDENNKVRANDQYFQAQWSPASDVTLHGGVRRSNITLTSQDNYIVAGNPNDSGGVSYSGTTPMLGVLYNLNSKINLYASWGKGFDAPTLNEIAYNPDATKSGLNLGLRPARSTQYEVGAKYQMSRTALLQAALFQAKTTDEIVVLSNNGGRSRFQNAGGTKRDGLELSYNNQFAKGWNTRWAYTYLDARYSDSFNACFSTTCTSTTGIAVPAGSGLPGVPKQSLFADVSWAAADGALRTGMEWRASGKVSANDLNTASAPGYGVFAARVSLQQKVGSWTLREFARVDNLLGKSYIGSVIVNQASSQFYEPAAGRSWLFGVSANYKF
jgi:iron complex outermembrane recepter protein